jgi:hypothetical protein
MTIGQPNRKNALSDCICYRFNMTVGRVVENQNLRHDVLLDDFAPGTPLRSMARRPLHDGKFERSGVFDAGDHISE